MAGEAPCFQPQLPFETVTTVYLGLGTNLGNRAGNLAEALRRIASIARIETASRVYESEPVGYADQPDFWNMVVRCTTDLPARQLMAELIAIETAMGRQRTFRNAPRLIDIDILLYDGVVVADRELVIPHPRMHERAFVLRPLLEIAPAVAHPRTGEPYAALLRPPDLERAHVVGVLEDLATNSRA